jgi:hypothetical protein
MLPGQLSGSSCKLTIDPFEFVFDQCDAGQGRRERRGTHRAVPRADGPAGGCPGRVLAVPPQQRRLRQRRRQAGESAVVRCLEQGHEHEGPPRVRGELQVPQAAADTRLASCPNRLQIHVWSCDLDGTS